jgi:MFS family permease
MLVYCEYLSVKQAGEPRLKPTAPAVGDSSPIYAGWWMVLASAIGQAVSPGPVAFYSLGVLMNPLSAAYGGNRAQLSLVATVLTVAIIVAMPLIGRSIDRYGARKVLLPSLIGFAITLAATGIAHSLFALYGLYAIVGIVSTGANSVPYMRVLSSWFDLRRGLAIGVASAGMGVGFALIPGYTQLLVNRVGLGGAYVGLGALVLALGVPVVALLLQDRPRPEQLSAIETSSDHADASELPGLTAREAGRTPQFWAILGSFMLVAGAIFALALHLIPAIEDIDANRGHAILAASLLGIAATLGRLCSGYLYDKIFVPFVAAGIFACGALGAGVLALGLPYPWPLVAAVLIGCCSGTEGDALAMLCSRYFGLREYGRIYGHAFSATMVGIAIVPYAMGFGYEHFHRYVELEVLLAVLLALAALAILSLGPFPSFDTAATAPREQAQACLPLEAWR